MILRSLILVTLFCGCEDDDVPCGENLSLVQERHVGDYTFWSNWTYFYCINDCYQERTFDGTITCLQNPEKVIINIMSDFEEESYIRVDSTIHAIHHHTGKIHEIGRFHGDSVSLAIHVGGLGGHTIFVTGVKK